jgi:hypothetical protein
MTRIALALAFALSALATSAIAADLPVKAPPAPPALIV